MTVYQATRDINVNGSLAYAQGATVPSVSVAQYRWDLLGWVQAVPPSVIVTVPGVSYASSADVTAASTAEVTRANAAYVSVGVTNIDAANLGDDLAAALAALPSGGGRVWANKASYVLPAGGLSTTKPNVELVGAGGGGQDSNVGNGATQLLVPAGAVGFTFNGPGTPELYRGPVLRRLHFRDATPGSGLGGIRVRAFGKALVEDCGCSDFTAGYGMKFDYGTASAQYAEVRTPWISRCQIGISNESNGLDVFGGYIDPGGNSSATPIAGTTGILQILGDTLRLMATRIQMCAIGVDLVAGDNHEMHGARSEACTTHVRVASDRARVYGGTFDNSISGGSGLAFDILATADDTVLLYPNIANIATKFADAGTNTKIYPRDTAWVALTLVNSWVNLGSGYSVAKYRKDPDGTVRLAGTVKSGTANSVIGTLPAGYCPAGKLMFTTLSDTGVVRLDIASTGTITYVSPTAAPAYVSLDGISFLPDQ